MGPRIRTGVVGLLALALACCALDDAERLGRVKPGMTPEQVERYLGPPTSVQYIFGNIHSAFDSYEWNFDGSNPAYNPVIRGMTIARAISGAPDWVKGDIGKAFEDSKAKYGTPTSVCTIQRIGWRDYQCCFSNRRLVSINEYITPYVVH